MARETQKFKVLEILIKKTGRDGNRFFYPYEVISDGDIFIGYKAPTRFCELCLEYPELIDTKMDGKYRIGRLKIENIQSGIESLPEEWQIPLMQEFNKFSMEKMKVPDQIQKKFIKI